MLYDPRIRGKPDTPQKNFFKTSGPFIHVNVNIAHNANWTVCTHLVKTLEMMESTAGGLKFTWIPKGSNLPSTFSTALNSVCSVRSDLGL